MNTQNSSKATKVVQAALAESSSPYKTRFDPKIDPKILLYESALNDSLPSLKQAKYPNTHLGIFESLSQTQRAVKANRHRDGRISLYPESVLFLEHR